MTTVSFKSDIFKFIIALNEVRTSTINKEVTSPVFYYTSLFQMNEIHEERPLQGMDDYLKHQFIFRTHHHKLFGLYMYTSSDALKLEAIKDATENIDRLRGYKPIFTGQHSYHLSDLLTEMSFADLIFSLNQEILSFNG